VDGGERYGAKKRGGGRYIMYLASMVPRLWGQLFLRRPENHRDKQKRKEKQQREKKVTGFRER